ncbi:nitrogen regulation protein NR(I) [Abyssibius alkaniclasticus]|uniref:nitrogen regulation protein NR(I) n=1 Tax=Abyssibius alkaniclasticus TaxID=2881234 RepID=UPI00405935A3
MDGTVIVADDDRSLRTVLSQALTRAGCRVRTTGTVSTLFRWVEEGEGDVVVSDVMMPDGDALEILPTIRKKRPDLPVIVMSAQNTVMTAIRASEAGAFDYVPKPFDLSALLALVNKALQQSRGAQRRAAPEAPPPAEERLPLIGRSAAMQEVYRIMARLMNTDLGVMITGASGTGKELVARALHDFGPRRAAPFMAMNMAAIPAIEVETELFGRGAMQGRFAEADGGTLFLDEVGDMPPEAQTRLLRVLQESEFGAKARADVRLIAATHQDLRNLVNEGRFREDLFYRLNVVPIRLPRLAERLEDIPDLVRHFLVQAQAQGLPRKTIATEALDVLKRQPWPGNVRELENLVQRLTILAPEDAISASLVSTELSARPSATTEQPAQSHRLGAAVEAHLKRYFAIHGDDLPPDGLYERILHEVELPLIALTLQATRGNQLRAAKLLGINRNTLRSKIAGLDIQVSRGKRLM